MTVRHKRIEGYGSGLWQRKLRHSSPVSNLSSLSKSQGVVGCGETKVEAKARARSAAMREGRRDNSRSVTLCRPEAEVIYAWAGRSWSDDQWRPATIDGIPVSSIQIPASSYVLGAGCRMLGSRPTFLLGDLGVGVIDTRQPVTYILGGAWSVPVELGDSGFPSKCVSAQRLWRNIQR